MTKEETAFEKVTRNMVENIEKTMDSGFKGFNDRLEKIETTQQELFNHQSNRLPPWVTIAFTIGGSILTGLVVYVVTH